MESLKDLMAQASEETAEVISIEELPQEEALPEEIVVAEKPTHEHQVAVVHTKSSLELLADEMLKKIQEINPTFKLDYINVFTRLTINTKGQFTYSLSGEDFILSDSINVKLLAGEYLHQYWGEKGSAEEGTLVCYSKDGQHTSVHGNFCDECPYNRLKCSIRFAIALNILSETESLDDVYTINMPSTGAFSFSDYVKLLMKRYKKGVADVVTNMYTIERAGKDKGDKFNAIQFKVSG